MNICIVGVGAIGGFIGARLATNHNFIVNALARGKSLAALNKHGWRLEQEGGLIQRPCVAVESASDLGVQDIVVIALKTPSLSQVLPTLAPLIDENTLVISAMNGIPWWFFRDLETQSNHPFQSVNPKGANGRAIPYKNIIGLVVHAAAVRSEPGIIQHKAGNRLIIGEPEGGKSDRVQALTDILNKVGFDCNHSSSIRSEIWYKLWGNMTMNPISAITGATVDNILQDPLVRKYCSAVMNEAAILGEKIGCQITEDPESRHKVTEKLGAIKTSMLQDVENGNAIELDSILGIIYELTQRLEIESPNIESLFGLTRLFATTKGLYGRKET
ncbi:MAG: 2-dehydropantoate 2-reductase [Gammaproteobacteria bacterium]|uniref:2-dehydropantoate 2-reductase n=1 Tax=Marinomonas polaris TaxID=293552 RepID=UPI001D4BE2E9|nr:2-dehydropantoate 2-reductase [Gammaproteobacteria bacterium]MBU1466868.1 2-dehydropantoate 2-reductase [Gammaproteobacteria bacterium]MBU2024176.1 2-dehydropantoate 2-reductase [Gammaproteobacteria bacterium]MBU2239328.1 2-dehydropantoate 2-reductase [Gammaproteobacteria bacterium]MBU2414393.1 2-dehydropantoate 2-reductase [Gammaproteobacteria bacterium]